MVEAVFWVKVVRQEVITGQLPDHATHVPQWKVLVLLIGQYIILLYNLYLIHLHVYGKWNDKMLLLASFYIYMESHNIIYRYTIAVSYACKISTSSLYHYHTIFHRYLLCKTIIFKYYHEHTWCRCFDNNWKSRLFGLIWNKMSMFKEMLTLNYKNGTAFELCIDAYQEPTWTPYGFH